MTGGATMLDLGEERAVTSDRRNAAIAAGTIVACCLLVAPVIGLPLGISYPVFAIVIALSIAAIAVTSVLLWAQARVTRSVPLSVLATGYALTAFVMLPYLLFYRGLWPQLIEWLSADAQTSAWLYFEWHALFILSTVAYFAARHRQAAEEPPDPAAFLLVRRRLVWAAAAIAAVTIPPAIWIDGLPVLASNGHFSVLFVACAGVIAFGAVAAIVVAYRANRFGTLLDIWLAVACLSVLADTLMTMFSRQFAAGWYVSRMGILVAASAVLFVLLFQTAKIYGQLALTAERLRSESLTDALTGLANRRRFDQHFEEVMRESTRAARPLALLMIDIDNFKSYNDTYGHQAGDECLRSIATILHNNAGRARDLVARTGGEEMAIIMPEADMRGALTVAERVRAAVESAHIPQGRGAVHPIVTISVGISATRNPATATIQSLVAAGDRALYRAKAAGRNCVVEAAELTLGLPNA